jgi:16S rRNA G966 N2-methylase RsmD
MKIRGWLLYRLISELRTQSLVFLRRTREIANDHFRDKRLGVETMEELFYQDNSSAHKDGLWYLPSPYSQLGKIFASIGFTPDDILIDIGCGKGRVCFAAATYNIKKIIGIELHDGLAKAAIENLKKLKLSRKSIQIINADASSYRFSDETVVFLYNPFGYKTIDQLLKNIKVSLEQNPRNLRIAYLNPRNRAVVDDQNWLVAEPSFSNEQYCVWRNVN